HRLVGVVARRARSAEVLPAARARGLDEDVDLLVLEVLVEKAVREFGEDPLRLAFDDERVAPTVVRRTVAADHANVERMAPRARSAEARRRGIALHARRARALGRRARRLDAWRRRIARRDCRWTARERERERREEATHAKSDAAAHPDPG